MLSSQIKAVWPRIAILMVTTIATAIPTAVAFAQATLRVMVDDQSGQPLVNVTVQLKRGSAIIASTRTNERGAVEFPNVTAGRYEISAARDDFEPLSRGDIIISPGAPVEVRFSLVPKIELKEGVTITGNNSTAVETGANGPAGQFERQQLYDLANKPANVADTLPLVPGVTRSQDGEINISGSGEHRSALVVNSADVTDPATGQFGMTIPVDSVERIEVFKSPFLAQYGRFTAGVVSVETRRGGDKWSFDVHDPLPAFRFRSGHLAGLLNASPRLVFNGPLIKNKLYLSEGIEYRLFKDPVRTLDHPAREMKTESVNSFTQLDYIFSPTHTVTSTLHIAPRKVLYANLNFFDPRPVSPNFSSRDYTGTIIDRLAIGGHLLESTFAHKQYGSDVWGQGRAEMTLTPTGNRGNYFSEQDRRATRFEWIEQFTPATFNLFGAHNLRFGTTLARTQNKGQFFARGVRIEDQAGRLRRRIDFDGGRPFDLKETEMALYGQDNWILHPQFAINYGARIERQSLAGGVRVAPRFGLSWAPFGMRDTIVRGGIGVFYDRVPLNIYAFNSYPEQIITTYRDDGAVIDGPRRYTNVITRTNKDFRLVREANRVGNFSPHSTTWSLEFERGFARFLRLKANYLQSQSGGLALLEPGLANGRDALILNGQGSSRYRQFETTAKVVWREEENMVFSYVRSRARGDINEFTDYLGNFPFPVIRQNQYTNLPTDLPHRFLAYGLIKAPWRVRVAPLIEYRNGFPYAATDALQNYFGVPNSDRTRFLNFYSLDLRLMKDFDVKFRGEKYTVRLSFVGYNVTNHFNPIDVRRNVADPQYGLFFGRYRRWFKMDFEVFF
jgi:hypothetical protein